MGMKNYHTPHVYFIAHLCGMVDLRAPAQHRIGNGPFPQDPVGGVGRCLFDTESENEGGGGDANDGGAGPSQPDVAERPLWPAVNTSGRLTCPNCIEEELKELTGQGRQRTCYGPCGRDNLRDKWMTWSCSCGYCICLRCMRGRR